MLKSTSKIIHKLMFVSEDGEETSWYYSTLEKAEIARAKMLSEEEADGYYTEKELRRIRERYSIDQIELDTTRCE